MLSDFSINNDKCFDRLILILSGDISLKPGPIYNHHPPNFKASYIFKIKGLHLLRLNLNSLLPKIDQLSCTDKLSNVAVIRITESPNQNSIIIFLTQKSR